MRSLFRAWWDKTEAATAVEFSMVGVPMVMMTIGIIEMALMFTSQSLLQESTFTASRLIRTGQIQKSPGTGQEKMFRDAVCDFAALLIPCNQIQFQVQKVPSFSAADAAPPQFDADGKLLNSGFDPGVESEVVVVRVVYNYPIKTPLMASMLSNMSGGKRQMLSTMVLQTEPYVAD